MVDQVTDLFILHCAIVPPDFPFFLLLLHSNHLHTIQLDPHPPYDTTQFMWKKQNKKKTQFNNTTINSTEIRERESSYGRRFTSVIQSSNLKHLPLSSSTTVRQFIGGTESSCSNKSQLNWIQAFLLRLLANMIASMKHTLLEALTSPLAFFLQ